MEFEQYNTLTGQPYVYVVFFEDRDLIGRIVERIAYVFASKELAAEYARRHNEDDSTSPRTALVRRHYLFDTLPKMLPGDKPYRHPNSSKLTPADVVAIRNKYAGGATLERLAEQYGCSTRAIDDVVKRKSWEWV